jgi:cytochrome c oxidase cbb3-type subunit 3
MATRVPFVFFVSLVLASAPQSRSAQGVAENETGPGLFEKHCSACHGPHGEGGKGPTLAQPSLPRAGDEASLVRIIRDGINGTEMPQARLGEQQIVTLVAFVKSLGSRPIEPLPGDAGRGEKLYGTKGGCAQCHTLRGHGGAFGPDLSDIGLRRSAAYLRRALTEPDADVPLSFSAYRWDISLPLNFLYVRAITREGREVAGVRVNEDTFSIQIREISGRVHSFFKDELAELHKEFGKSPMPSFATTLTKDELDDLTAYLVSLREKQ